MKKTNINLNFDNLINLSISHLGNNLKAIFMFGSGNNKYEFIQGLSDLDFIYILEKIDYNELQLLKSIRINATELYKTKIDIKPFTTSEFKASIKEKGSFEFFTGWGLEMIKSGKQKCLYNSGDINLNYNINSDRIKKDALDRAHYYITKLRKIFYSNEKRILRGQITNLDELDILKITSSAIKNVLTFSLAYRGIITDSYEEIIKYIKKNMVKKIIQ